MSIANDLCPIFLFHYKDRKFPTFLDLDVELYNTNWECPPRSSPEVSDNSPSRMISRAPLYFYLDEDKQCLTYIAAYGGDKTAGIQQDVRYLQIFYDHSGKIKSMFYNSAEEGGGLWVSPKKLMLCGGRPYVYVSLKKHYHLPRPDSQFKEMLKMRCSMKTWDPQINLVRLKTNPFSELRRSVSKNTILAFKNIFYIVRYFLFR